jgi:A/G-specific adenine glycosylase
MLQQTRVAAVIPYYERFIAEFPDVATLARAREERVLSLWSGLGYYSRARNLLAAAREMADLHGGEVPDDPEALAALPGIGRYTRGAILSIAFDREVPVVDGNVARVLSRWFLLAGDPRRSAFRETLWSLAAALVPQYAPGDFNQAMMELGATVCLPKKPVCGECPLAFACRAHDSGRVAEFPTTTRKEVSQKVTVFAALVHSPRGIWLEQKTRGANRDLWDLPAVEIGEPLADGAGDTKGLRRLRSLLGRRGLDVRKLERAGVVTHAIMKNRYRVTVFRGRAKAIAHTASGRWFSAGKLDHAPLTARTRKALSMELDPNSDQLPKDSRPRNPEPRLRSRKVVRKSPV